MPSMAPPQLDAVPSFGGTGKKKLLVVAGNALDKATVSKYVNQADAVCHCIGLLFDVNSGIDFLNTFTSASGSKPDESSTYDNITRQSAFNVIDAMRAKAMLPALLGKRTPL